MHAEVRSFTKCDASPAQIRLHEHYSEATSCVLSPWVYGLFLRTSLSWAPLCALALCPLHLAKQTNQDEGDQTKTIPYVSVQVPFLSSLL